MECCFCGNKIIKRIRLKTKRFIIETGICSKCLASLLSKDIDL